MSLLLGGAAGCGGRVFGLGNFLAQRFDLIAQRDRAIDRLGWRNECAGIEGRLPSTGTMKPDAERARELERGQGLGMATCCFVDGRVPGFAQCMEDVGDLLRNDPLIGEPPERLLEGEAPIDAEFDDVPSSKPKLPSSSKFIRLIK